MILSTGIDIVAVYRIRKTIARTPRFVDRVFTAGERSYCEGKGVGAPQSFAGRFAAKEAFLKALKTGWRGKISWTDIEVIIDDMGAPSLKLAGEALELLKQRGADRIHLSITHTEEYAFAQVILESTGPRAA
jgi:holo-[acyl-carrier protein] synthase